MPELKVLTRQPPKRLTALLVWLRKMICWPKPAPAALLPCGWLVPGANVPQNDVFQVDKVRHVGDRVIAVVAESAAIAQDALDLIEVDYEPLPAVVDAREAMDPGGTAGA